MSTQPHLSPANDIHEQLEAFFLPYGTDEHASMVVERFAELDMEYAALRKGCVVFDENHMGTIEITGNDRLPFLNSMLTAKVDDLTPGKSRWSFWLNRKGRIDADLRLTHTQDRTLARVDRHIAARTADALNAFVFTEDAGIRDASDEFHRFAIHGPSAPRLLAAALDADAPLHLPPLANATARFRDAELVIERDDLCAEIGLSVCVPVAHARDLYRKLLDAAEDHPELKARPAGWMAINTARIEAGAPLFNLDFGENNLPAETGIIDQRVNFNKGCYLGQEVVARMHARGAGARKVVALRIEDQRITPENTDILQPTTGSQVFHIGKETETPVGVVTSSTISPMLGAIPIAFAMIRTGDTQPGTRLSVSAEGQLVHATVQESLAFWKPPRAGADQRSA